MTSSGTWPGGASHCWNARWRCSTRLERRAAEPGDLESLFRIDHLTTRMRRHAESLIVLAGDSPQRAFRDPVPFVDVLRAAAAEVEDYTRIRVICRTPAALAGPAVADVIHMLAEFVENATIFSPPNTEVRVTGDLVANGFAVDIEDRGLGMSDEEITADQRQPGRPAAVRPVGLGPARPVRRGAAGPAARHPGDAPAFRLRRCDGHRADPAGSGGLRRRRDGHSAVRAGRRGGRLTTAVRHAVTAQPVTAEPPATGRLGPARRGLPRLPSRLPPDRPEPVTGPGDAEPLPPSPVLAAEHVRADAPDSPPG